MWTVEFKNEFHIHINEFILGWSQSCPGVILRLFQGHFGGYSRVVNGHAFKNIEARFNIPKSSTPC